MAGKLVAALGSMPQRNTWLAPLITGERCLAMAHTEPGCEDPWAMPATTAVASALRISVGEPVISLSRLRLIDDVPLLAEEIWLQRSRFEAIVALDTAEFGDLLYPLYEDRCGQVVVSADEVLTVEIATEMQSRLLRLEANAPLIVIERLAFDLERRPIEWRRSRGPADRFRYHAEIR